MLILYIITCTLVDWVNKQMAIVLPVSHVFCSPECIPRSGISGSHSNYVKLFEEPSSWFLKKLLHVTSPLPSNAWGFSYKCYCLPFDYFHPSGVEWYLDRFQFVFSCDFYTLVVLLSLRKTLFVYSRIKCFPYSSYPSVSGKIQSKKYNH
jgi:hypothetical protein